MTNTPGMRIRPDDRTPPAAGPESRPERPRSAWLGWDGDTVVTAGANGRNSVDHAASAGANLVDAGEHLVNAVDPTNHFRRTNNVEGPGNMASAFRFLVAPWNFIAEISDVVLAIPRAIKDLGDAAAHGVAALFDKLRGVRPDP